MQDQFNFKCDIIKLTLWILLFQTKDIIIMFFSYEAIYQSSLTLLSANYWSEL